MCEERNSVVSTPTETDKIGPNGRYRCIGKTQISADISVDLCFSAYIFKHSDRNDLNFFGHFETVSVYD